MRFRAGREVAAASFLNFVTDESSSPIESLNYLLEEDLRRVKHWQDSGHFQRWMASACLQNESRMHKIEGFSGLPALMIRLQELCKTEQQSLDKKSIAA